MKTKMEDIDKLIKETLTTEEAKFYDDLEESNILGMIKEVFTGKNSWLAILMNFVNLIAFGLFIYCTVRFLEVETTQELIKWGAAGFLCINFTSMIKMYFWMQGDKKTILKEVKRLELLVSSMLHKM